MPSDQLVSVPGSGAAPLSYQIAAAQEVVLKAAFATFNGAGTVSTWLPCLRILSPSGQVVGEYVTDASVAAGGSAEVSFAPFLRAATTTASSGGVFPPGTGAGWERTAEPLISPTAVWEGGVLQEPNVLYDTGSTTYTMWYTGNFTNLGVGVATCSGNPTVPGNWTKNAGNPVLGQGGSGVAGFVGGFSIYLSGGTYYGYYYDTLGGGNWKAAHSANGIAWTSDGTMIASGSFAGTHGYANSAVWLEGGTWKAIIEASTTVGGGPPWQLYYAEAAAPTSGWSVISGPLSNLDVPAYTQGASGPSWAQINGVLTPSFAGEYRLWYHVNQLTGGFQVSDIVHGTGATGPTVAFAGTDLQANRGTYEKEQAADPSVLQVGSTSYLFYDGVDNVTPAGYINLATFNGNLEDAGLSSSASLQFAFAEVIPSATIASVTYVDASNVGPAATITVGSNGMALIGWSAQLDSNTLMSVSMSGANTLAANDTWGLGLSASGEFIGRSYVFTGLTPGATTFTAQYRVLAGSHFVQRRSLWAMAL